MIHRPFVQILLASSVGFVSGYAEDVINLERIQVEANTATLEERRNHSIAKRIISGAELTQYGDLNALEILKRTPGVSIPEGKGKKASPGKGYTVVMIDGEEASTGSKRRGNPLEQIASDMIERIEVMTNGSAEYTAESMGGIVNIILKKPKEKGLTTAKMTGGVYGGDIPMETLFIQREGKSGNLAYLINLNATDNRQKDTSSTSKVGISDEFRKETTRNQSLGITTKLTYTPSSKDKYTFEGSITKNGSKADSDMTGTSRSFSNDDKSRGTMLWSSVKGEHHLSGTELVDWRVKFHENSDTGESGSFQSLPTSSISLQQDKNFFRVMGADGSYSLANGDHFIKTGIELKGLDQRDEVRRDVNGTDVTAPADNVSMHQTKGAFYTQDEVSFGESLVVTPGLRYETISRNYGATGHIDYLAPSLHILARLTSNDNLRASVAKTVKLPRLDELSTSVDSTLDRNDIHHPDLTGNANLTEEKALSYELRLEHFFEDKGIVSVGSFYRNIDDKIEKMTVLEGGRYVLRPYNSGKGSIWGIELELKKSLSAYIDSLGIFANATFQNSSITNTATGLKRPIKQTSNYLYNIGADHTLPAYKLTYGTAYRYVGGYDDPLDENQISQVQKGYGTLDMYVNKRLDETFKLQLNWKNITHATIVTTSNTPNETQINRDNSNSSLLLTLEGRW
ncbi:MAG TPA: TonB-dependent receptor [Sulfuricurvum sp.]|nr:TonB-dependent receptor [Sulfuricurvum sp.]